MAMANMNLIGVFVTKLWSVQALACVGVRWRASEIFKFRGYNYENILTGQSIL